MSRRRVEDVCEIRRGEIECELGLKLEEGFWRLSILIKITNPIDKIIFFLKIVKYIRFL